MKRFLKIAFIIPILFLTSFFAFACGEITMQSISLSISADNATYSNGYYYVDKTNSAIQIETTINPTDFKPQDLTWKSSNTTVATVYYNSFKTVGVGETTITASYKNSDGKIITSNYLRISVNESNPEITFNLNALSKTYNGLDQKQLFMANQETGTGDFVNDGTGKFKFQTNGKFTYEYYDYQTKQMTNEIVNAGSYKILCKSIENSDIQTTVDIEIKKHKLSFVASTYNYIEYGDALPQGLINENDIPTDFINQTEIGTDFNGIGKDAQSVIGKKIDTTAATVGSNVSSYKTNVYFELKDEFKPNYELTANVTQTTLNIVKKRVVLVVEDQLGEGNEGLVYGQSIVLKKYKMYSYKNYTTAGEELKNLLLDNTVDYNSNIYLGDPSYKIASIGANEQTIYTKTNLNSVGVLNVLFDTDGETILPYYLFYDGAQSNGNLNIDQVVPGKVKIKQRSVEILPTVGQSKNYAQADPEKINYQITSGSFVSNDPLKTFLNINYNMVIDNAGNDDIVDNNPNYNYNFTAPVGSYFYKIDNTLNKNYIVNFAEQAIEDTSANADNSNKVKFEVKPCDIYIDFVDVTENYKTPNSKDGILHTISYFSKTNASETGIVPNYRTQINSLKINNHEYVSSSQNNFILDSLVADESFETNGRFYVVINKTPKSSTATYQRVGGFYMSLNLTQTATTQGCFMSYSIVPSIHTMEDPLTASTNYKFDVSLTSKLNLNKIKISVIPTLTESIFTKVYDATNEIQSNFGFYADGIANTDVYYTLSDNTVDINSVLSYPNPLLTLNYGDGKFIKINDDGSEQIVDTMRNVGKYKIMLRDLSKDANNGFVEGKEYYDISLDNSRVYYYTVKPRPLTITPNAGQSKVYASYDKELIYTISNLPENSTISPEEEGVNPLTIDGFTITGSLSRIAGESVGNYQIKLNNLYFGENFTLSLYQTPVNYQITKRNVKVKPIEYNILYGEDYPTQIGYEKEILKTDEDELLDLNVIKNGPTFSGQFVVNGSKIGNYYPVKIIDGKISGYQILQGTFVCDDNYSIVFDDSSLFTVNKRPVILNITAQSKKLTDAIPTTGIDLTTQFYDLSVVIDNATTSLKVNIEKKSNVYLIKSYTLRFIKNGSDVSSSYDVTLGKDVVYNIDVTMIYLKVMNNDKLSNTKTVVYNGEYRDNTYIHTEDVNNDSNEFSLVSENEGFKIVESQTKFIFNYYFFANNKQNYVEKPKDVGSYTAKINLGTAEDDYRIVIYNEGLQEYIVFETLEENELVIDNYALSLSNVVYLNIEKANITVTDNSLLAFEKGLQYGTSKLFEIEENDYANNKIIFNGVGNDKIVLKKFAGKDYEGLVYSGLNFKTSITKEELLSYNANSEYILNLQVEAVKLNGSTPEIDASGNQISNGNYNPLYINVSLRVIPQNFVYTDFKFFAELVDGKIVYNSLPKSVELYLISNEVDEDGEPVRLIKDNIKYHYDYIRLSTVYNDEPTGSFEWRSYDKTTNTVSGEVATTPYGDIDLTTSRRAVINGTNYIIINEEYAVLISNNQEDVPKSAGIYICLATCQTDSNHTFAESDGETTVVKGQNITFSCLYEIQKSQDININWLKDSFYYTTVFDFEHPDTLPFEYEVPPEVKDYVEYVLQGDIDIPVNNMLNIGEYNVALKVNTKNYYYNEVFKFKVEDLLADIVVPVNSSYVFTGSAINSFLTGIGATLKDKDGKPLNTIYWTAGNEEFTFMFKEIEEDNTEKEITNDITKAPSQVGNYVLEIFYKSKERNYIGNGRYYYSIIKKSYTGSIGFVDTTIFYDPSLTPQEFYDLIIGRMFTIGEEANIDSLELRSETDGNVEIKREGVSLEDYAAYNSVGQKTIYLTVKFNDGITANTKLKALLNIQRYTLESTDFSFVSSSTDYEYSGYSVYHALKYQNIDLSPDKNGDLTIKDGENDKYYVEYNDNVVVIKDRLSHELFTLTYEYTRQFPLTDSYETINGYPIIPNAAGYDKQNNYRVNYKFNYGSNYSGRNIGFSYVDFSIRKAAKLILSYENDTVIYSGTGLSEYEPKNLKVLTNKNVSTSNLKYEITRDSSLQANNYAYKKGVYLLLYFTKDGQKINAANVINEGKYEINMTLYYCVDSQNGQKTVYNVCDFFESYEFGTLDGTMLDFSRNVVNGEYGIVYTKELVIEKAKFNVSNVFEVLDLGTRDVDYKIEESTIFIKRDSSVLKLKSGDLSLKICVADIGVNNWTDLKTEFDLENLNTEYRFNAYIEDPVEGYQYIYKIDKVYQFVISDPNHSSSIINFKIVESF